ncbi:MAG: glycosyltransferase [Magnetococcales bacterium]|nr:glycosyltransferase [Magnetococcales bacterium]
MRETLIISFVRVAKKTLKLLLPKPVIKALVALKHLIIKMRLYNFTPCDSPGSGIPVIVGLHRSPIGIGESARLCKAAFDKAGWLAHTFDVSSLFLPDSITETKPDDIATFKDSGPLVIHANPPELPFILNKLGSAKTKGRLIISYWAWELPKLPKSWIPAFDLVHEVWTPSNFCAQAISQHTSKKVRVVPHPVDCFQQTELSFSFDNLQIPNNACRILTMYDMNSSQTRKNPKAAIEAFKSAMGKDMRAVLILKVVHSQTNKSEFAKLLKDINGYPNIKILTANMTSEQVRALLKGVDIVISLHRSEGFGLVMAEAMYLGKVVIGTDWSANQDFMDVNCSILIPCSLIPVKDTQGIYQEPGQVWADPDIQIAAKQIKRMVDQPDLRKQLGNAAYEKTHNQFTSQNYFATLGKAFMKHASNSPDFIDRGDKQQYDKKE